MKNLEQLRAAHAWAFWKDRPATDVAGQDGGDVVSGLPAYLMNNGLLATLAFAVAERKVANGQVTVSGMEKLLAHLAKFLGAGESHANIIPSAIPANPQQAHAKTPVDELIRHLTTGSSLRLQRCTAEALELVRYLKRFTPPSES